MEEYPRVIYGHDGDGEPRCLGVDAGGVAEVSATRVSGWKTAVIDVSEDDSLSGPVDLGEHFRYLAVMLPQMTLTRVGLQVAVSMDGSYVPLGSGSAAQTDTTPGEYATVFDTGGWRFVRIHTSEPQAENRQFALQGVRG